MSKVNKFRMWDKRLKKMAFTGYHVVGEVTAFGGMEIYIKETESETGYVEWNNRWNDFVEMQYIGIQDKNGLDVYEQDQDESGNIVMWSDDMCLYCLHHYIPLLEKWSPASYPIDKNRINIIGLNPELL